MEALQFQSVYRVHVHYSDENISSLICTTVPEILYYNRPGVLFDFVVLNVTYVCGFTGSYHSAKFVHTSQRADCLQDSE